MTRHAQSIDAAITSALAFATLYALALIYVHAAAAQRRIGFANSPWRAAAAALGDIALLFVCMFTIFSIVNVTGNGCCVALNLSMTFAAAFLLGLSIGFFHATGAFLDVKGYEFIFRNFVSLVKHLHAADRFSVPLLVLCSAIAAAAATVVGVAAPAYDGSSGALSGLALMLAIAAAAHVSTLLFGHSPFGTSYPQDVVPRNARWLEFIQRQRCLSGPLSRVAFGNIRLPLPRAIPSRDAPETTAGTRVGLPGPTAYSGIILIVVESWRADTMTAASALHLPNLSQLARNSTLFVNHYASASHSNYADVSISDGRYPLRSALQYNYQFSNLEDHTLLHEHLKSLGYRCGFFSAQDETWGCMERHLRLDAFNVAIHAGNRREWRAGLRIRASHSGKIDDADLAKEAACWVGSADAPYFLQINLQRTHFPYTWPHTSSDKRPEGKGSKMRGSIGSFGNIAPTKLQGAKHRYTAALRSIDGIIGTLLSDLGICAGVSNHIVVVTGDTGQGFGEHGLCAHGCELFDEIIKVPLLVTRPQCSGRVVDTPSSHVDILPTICSLAGFGDVPGIDGRDLFGGDVASRPAVFSVCQTSIASQVARITKSNKVVHDFTCRKTFTYDIQLGAAETNPAVRPLDAEETIAELGAQRRPQGCEVVPNHGTV